MKLDTAREAAAEAGYIPENTTLPEFLDFIDREMRGERVYPQGAGPENRPTDPAELEHQEGQFRGVLDGVVREAGGNLSGRERARALELWSKEGLDDPVEILERIALETGDTEGADDDDRTIPGWNDIGDDDDR